jgi:hypothetical protein
MLAIKIAKSIFRKIKETYFPPVFRVSTSENDITSTNQDGTDDDRNFTMQWENLILVQSLQVMPFHLLIYLTDKSNMVFTISENQKGFQDFCNAMARRLPNFSNANLNKSKFSDEELFTLWSRSG